jgi:sugar phosphate isomerase/epimerase
MIHIACSTLGFTKMKLGIAAEKIAELGFDYVDLAMFHNWAHIDPAHLANDPDGPEARAQGVASLFQLNGLQCVAVNASLSGGYNDDKPTIEQNLREFDAIARFAQTARIPVICLSAGGIQQGVAIEQQIAKVAEHLKRLVDIASDMQVALTVETHSGSVAEEYDHALALVEAVPGLGLTWDPSHFIMKQLDVAASEKLLARAKHVHVRDAIAGSFQAPFGKGQLDLDWFAAALIRANYKGAVAIEYIDSHEERDITGDITALQRALRERFLR